MEMYLFETSLILICCNLTWEKIFYYHFDWICLWLDSYITIQLIQESLVGLCYDYFEVCCHLHQINRSTFLIKNLNQIMDLLLHPIILRDIHSFLILSFRINFLRVYSSSIPFCSYSNIDWNIFCIESDAEVAFLQPILTPS